MEGRDSGGRSVAPPLVRKLGLEPGMRVRIVDAPAHYWELLGSDAETLELVELGSGNRDRADFIHVFAQSREALRERVVEARAAMAKEGTVWVSWPKKTSGVASDVGRAEVQQEGQAVGLVDVKVCAVDDTWSALKFVVPLELRSLGG